MKHTDFWKDIEKIRQHECRELAAAIRAHGGSYTWFDPENFDEENDDVPDDLPLVAFNLDYCGPVDVAIHSVSVDSLGDIHILGHLHDEYSYTDPMDEHEYDIDDMFMSHIDFITGAIPETDDVKDVSEPCDEFPITYLSRADLEDKYDVANITDDQMRQVAKRMGSAYCENGFWIDLDIIADYLELPKKKSDGI